MGAAVAGADVDDSLRLFAFLGGRGVDVGRNVLAAHVLGFVDANGHGQVGMEQALDKRLVDPAMRGRVMALYMMIFMGGTPLGAPLIGWIGDAWGPRWTIAVGAIAVGVTLLVVAAWLGRIQKTEARQALEAVARAGLVVRDRLEALGDRRHHLHERDEGLVGNRQSKRG